MKGTSFHKSLVNNLNSNTLTNRIIYLKSIGYKSKDAVSVAYNEMREAWKEKHPTVKLPSWLRIETRGKNPVDPFTNKRVKRKSIKQKAGGTVSYPKYKKVGDKYIKVARKYGVRSISPDTTEIKVAGKTYSILDAYPSLSMATKYANDYIKNGQGRAVVRDLSEKAGRLRYALFVTDSFTERFYKGKNPVRPLKNKKDWNIDRFKDGKWEPVASFKFNKKKEAIAYANAYANAHKVKMKIYK